MLLVRFDGQTASEAGTVHAPAKPFLAPAGFVRLTGGGGSLDRIAWGAKQRGAVRLSRGSYHEKLSPGTSLGRAPGLVASNPLQWVPYSPAQATPGLSNPQPGVEILLPMDGAVVTAQTVNLTWYTVAGAARYRVQVASDPSFGSPVIDQTVDRPPIAAGALAPATYVWRVQAITPEGTATGYSPPSKLTVRAARGPASRARAFLDWWLPALHAQPQPQPNIDDELPTVLDVPLIMQHKDTGMLLLETRQESGSHAWDVDHRDLDPSDPADNMNSVAASVAMLAQYYGGRISQDRINYQIFNGEVAGPEEDFNWGRTYDAERITQAMIFALGLPAPTGSANFATVVDHAPDEWDRWRRRDYIKHGIPSIVCKNQHCMAVVGFGGRDNLVVLNDPAVGTYLAPLSFLNAAVEFDVASSHSLQVDHYQIETHPVHPRADEPEISLDSDGDGVVDFDEIHRFQTNPNLKDHDDDELPDKEDIKASVHDPRHGYAYGGSGRDFDGDGTMMELDDDADNGGCLDGWEDTNKNGKFEQGPAETDNFEKKDDPCVKGDFKALWHYVQPPSGGLGQRGMEHRHTATFALRPKSDGSLTGRGHVLFGEEIESWMKPGACRYTMTVGPVSWTVDLTGQATKLPDGSLEVTMRATPEKGPPIPALATNECPPFSSTQTSPPQAWQWGGPYKLVNGLYKHTFPMSPIPPGATGTQSTEIAVEMKREQRQ